MAAAEGEQVELLQPHSEEDADDPRAALPIESALVAQLALRPPPQTHME